MKKSRIKLLSKLISEVNGRKFTKKEKAFLEVFFSILNKIIETKKNKFGRFLSFGDYFIDRWIKAELMNFGNGTSVYDNVLIIGDVKVGENTWIGPNVILDGSGKLEIGSNCSISAGVQIYTHDSVKWAITGGKQKYEYSKTIIEDNCYIGPYCVITKGVRIGKGSIIGAFSLVNKDIPPFSKAFGIPVKVIERQFDEYEG